MYTECILIAGFFVLQQWTSKHLELPSRFRDNHENLILGANDNEAAEWP